MYRILYFLFALSLLSCSRCPKELRSALPTEMMIDVEGGRLFCRAVGKGSPVVVVHGGPGLSQEYLLPHLYQLAENHLVIFYDQRGSGQSTGDVSPETINIQMFVDDLDSVRQALHLDKISLLGHSWGGYVAMQYAIAHPEAVDKLILSNSMPSSTAGVHSFVEEYLRRTAPIEQELTALHDSLAYRQGDPDVIEHFQRLLFRTYCYLPEKGDLLSLRAAPTASMNGEKVGDIFRKSLFEVSYDLHDALHKLNIKTLVLHGDVDPIPTSTAKTIHDSIPNSQYVVMEHCGHFPFVEDPEVFFKNVTDFLK